MTLNDQTGEPHVHEAEERKAPEAQVTKAGALYQLQFQESGLWVIGMADLDTAITSPLRQRALLFEGGTFLDEIMDNSILVAHMVHESAEALNYLASLSRRKDN